MTSELEEDGGVVTPALEELEEGPWVDAGMLLVGVKSLASKCHCTLSSPRLISPMEANAERLRTAGVLRGR